MARLRATAPAARSVLDDREHGGMLGRVGKPILAHQTDNQKVRVKHHQKASSRLLSAFEFARLDLLRERKGVTRCEKEIRALRKALNKVTERATGITPEVLCRIEAHRELLEALSGRCEACGRCALADD
jgi:hypothetical protein